MAPSAARLDLSDDQRFALMKFRRSVHEHLKPHHDDHYLLRWLRARNWNPEAAEKMLKDSIKWREEWKVDSLQDWTPPEVCQKFYPSGICGFDSEGSPIVIVPFAGMDMWGMIHCIRRSDIIRMTLRTIEYYLKVAFEQSEKHGVQARQVVAIIDLDSFNMKQYVWKPAGELVVTLLKMYEANYPEILKACYLINTPAIFNVAFSIIKGFLNEDTISKISMFKADKKKWSKAILKNIDPDQIPQYYGGNQVDENGDPKCSAKVPQGGKIPKSYYFKKDRSAEGSAEKEFATSEVKKSAKLCLEFDAPEPGNILKWEFKTENNDIKFGVFRIENGEEIEEIPVHKVQCSKYNEIGVLSHEKPTKYKVIFDNSSSMLRSKKVYHCIQILPPLSERNL